ncbi:MAG: hypothetical protein AOA65_0712 [Candidatus Bathyarchaeota archaeon BA1]|nr:MAG: hypothetical protein AOA65_0712 [Candidatus Bathyarchaeota archaeon BA1]
MRKPGFLKRLTFLSILFGPFGHIYRKITTAVLIFTTVLFAFLLAAHCIVYVSVYEDRVEVSVPLVLTRRTFTKDDVLKAFIVDWKQESGFKPVLRMGGTSLENEGGLV